MGVPLTDRRLTGDAFVDRLNKIREVMEADALYVTATVTADEFSSSAETPLGVPVPASISLFCDTSDTCARVVPWDCSSHNSGRMSLFADDQRLFHFVCRVCRKSTVSLLLHGGGSRDEFRVTLVGRIPRPRIVALLEMVRTFTEEDARYYENALRCRADAMGVAAVTYLRRVVENEMDRLLDLLIQLLEQSGDPTHTELLQEAKRLTTLHRFSEKAKAAAAVLPQTFFPGEHNPFERLHDLASDGVHNLNDEESCDRFDDLRAAFELLFERLTRDVESRRLYAEGVKKLGGRKKLADRQPKPDS